MKLSLEEKVKYVLQYNRGEVIKTPDDAKKRSSFMSSLREWAKRYNEERENGLKREKNKTCTEEEKKAIVRRIWNRFRNSDEYVDKKPSSLQREACEKTAENPNIDIKSATR